VIFEKTPTKRKTQYNKIDRQKANKKGEK